MNRITSDGGDTTKCGEVQLEGVNPVAESGTFLATKPEECSRQLSAFIVGGTDATIQEFPFYALLGFKTLYL